jgi:peptidoglycan/LPS O-acetylase OafA/YrhL
MKTNNHFAWIDFLRGVSCLGIVLYHVRVDLWVGWFAIANSPNSYSLGDRLATLLTIPLPFLRPFVMLFFIISGFCIHYPYANRGRSLELKSYALRRFFRIYPPYLIAVLLTAWVQWVRPEYFSKSFSSGGDTSKFVETIFMVQNYGPDAGQMAGNPSLWSLPIEAELYIVYPIVYWLLIRCGIRTTLSWVGFVSLGTLGFLLITNWNNPEKFLGYVGNFALYWIIWVSGALLAEWVKQEQLPKWQPWFWVVMAVTFAISMVTTLLKTYIGLQELVWSSFFFMIVLWGLTQSSQLTFLRHRLGRAFVSLGLISYSLYLIHYPFFKLCGAFWVGRFGAKPSNFLIPLAFTLLAIALAKVFYHLVEAPNHRLARKLAK